MFGQNLRKQTSCVRKKVGKTTGAVLNKIKFISTEAFHQERISVEGHKRSEENEIITQLKKYLQFVKRGTKKYKF